MVQRFDLHLWALAFTLLDWPERQKAQLWAALQLDPAPALAPDQAEALERLGGRLPQLRQEALDRGTRLLLPGDEGADPLIAPLPYPVALWVRGSLPPPGLRVAIVGSRVASKRGRERTRAWARALTEAGVAVISGLARGIDGAAHEGALTAGPTWGVMGSGLDHPYPPEHRPLMDRMVAAGGGVLTPFPPQAPPLRWHFPRAQLAVGGLDPGRPGHGGPPEVRLPGHGPAGPGPGQGVLGLPRRPGGPFGRRSKFFIKGKRCNDLSIPRQPPGGPFRPTGHLTKVWP